jgi:hypothetical protein
MIDNSFQQARESISTDPQVLSIPEIFGESLKVWVEPHIVYNRGISNSWIAGSSTNGIVGTWTGTVDGGQLVVGETGNSELLLAVIPSSNVWVNFLRPNSTNDTVNGALVGGGSNINTTTFRLTGISGQSVRWLAAYGGASYRGIIPFFSTDGDRTNMSFGSNTILEYSLNGGTYVACPNKETTLFGSNSSTVYFRIRWTASSLYWQTVDGRGMEFPIVIRLIPA